MSLSSLIQSTQRWRSTFSIKGSRYGFEPEPTEPRIPPEQTLQRLEAEGASPADLARALMDTFQIHFPEFRGLSCGFRRREQLSPRNPRGSSALPAGTMAPQRLDGGG